jgi:dienelactone hydrolase
VLADINARVARYRSTEDVQEFLDRYYETTGRLRIPMLTLYNERDPVVPGFNEARYRERVARRGNASLLVQISFAGRYGHTGLFTPQEISQAFGELVLSAGKRDRDDDDDRDADGRAIVAQGRAGVSAGW